MSRFNEGDKVICVNDYWSNWPIIYPKLMHVYTIERVLFDGAVTLEEIDLSPVEKRLIEQGDLPEPGFYSWHFMKLEDLAQGRIRSKSSDKEPREKPVLWQHLPIKDLSRISPELMNYNQSVIILNQDKLDYVMLKHNGMCIMGLNEMNALNFVSNEAEPCIIPERTKEPQINVKFEVTEEKQVIVRFYVHMNTGLRIWPTTYLICNHTGHRSKLLFSENIGVYPAWKNVRAGSEFYLIFEGLPKACKSFDLIEVIPEPGAFIVKGLHRNETDVYLLGLNEAV